MPTEHLRARIATFTRYALYAGLALVTAFWLTGILARLHPHIDNLASFQRQFTLCAIAVLLMALALRHGRATALAGTIVALFLLRLATALPAPAPTHQTDTTPSLKILSANLLFSSPETARILDWINEKNPDIITFQEYSEVVHPIIAEALRERYPHSEAIPENSPHGVAFYSRLPFKRIPLPEADHKALKFAGRRHDQLAQYEFQINGKPITFFATHPPRPSGPHGYAQRNTEIILLGRLITDCKTPAIIAGDFNTTPWSPYFHDLIKQGHLQSADGGPTMHNTWPARDILRLGRFRPPFQEAFGIPIDFILTTPALTPGNFERGPAVGSDHFPIYAEITPHQ